MNPEQYAKAWALLVRRDGLKCHNVHCGRVPAHPVTDRTTQVKSLVIHHIDGDYGNNPEDGTNWMLLCQSCNVLLGRRKRPRIKATEHFARYGNKLKISHERERERGGVQIRFMEMVKNEAAERWFRRFVERTVEAWGEISKALLLDAAAEAYFKETGDTISQQALTRYLSKMTNEISGDYDLKSSPDGWVVFKKEVNTQEAAQ